MSLAAVMRVENVVILGLTPLGIICSYTCHVRDTSSPTVKVVASRRRARTDINDGHEWHVPLGKPFTAHVQQFSSNLMMASHLNAPAVVPVAPLL